MRRIPLEVRIIGVGKLKNTHFANACNEYVKRLSHYLKIEIIEVKDRVGKRKDDAISLYEEEQAINRVLRKSGHLIVLDSHGKQFSSEEFANKLQQFADTGKREIDYIIGGPLGLTIDLKTKAQELFSLSAMTLPHELARVVLLEQLYRACTILSGEKYHK